jgi:hypothetical protein
MAAQGRLPQIPDGNAEKLSDPSKVGLRASVGSDHSLVAHSPQPFIGDAALVGSFPLGKPLPSKQVAKVLPEDLRSIEIGQWAGHAYRPDVETG